MQQKVLFTFIHASKWSITFLCINFGHIFVNSLYNKLLVIILNLTTSVVRPLATLALVNEVPGSISGRTNLGINLLYLPKQYGYAGMPRNEFRCPGTLRRNALV